jgi:hypothetical protein
MDHIAALDENARELLRKAILEALPGTMTITVDAWTSG